MMRSTGHVWLAFAACLSTIVAAVGWLSFRALESENAEAFARQQAAVEENARLALWRIDSALAPLVTQESSRPAFSYETFYQTERPVSKGKTKSGPEPIVSPLVAQLPPQILLHFQFDASGHFSSPRIPPAEMQSRVVPRLLSAAEVAAAQKLLDGLKKSIDPPKLLAMLPAADASVTDVAPISGGGAVGATSIAAGNGGQLNANPNSGYQISGNLNRRANGQNYDFNNSIASQQPAQQAANQFPTAPQLNGYPGATNVQQLAQQAGPQQALDTNEIQRKQRDDNEFTARSIWLAQNMVNSPPNFDDSAAANPDEQRSFTMTPLWLADRLVLIRRVHLRGGDKVQGCLLDWLAIRQELLTAIDDLLPSAKLLPVTAADGEPQSRRSAVLPVRLEFSEQPAMALAGLSPVRMSLVLAWSSMLLGAAAVAMLLRGVMLLSERRAAFVSAVTHELRTPLTTFRMYAEMLAEGMVPDEASRRRYLDTLRIEADRLTHLVENVLAYSRLERGGLGKRVGPIAVRALLNPAASRLKDRAEQAGFQLVVEADDSVADRTVIADSGAVEQILFNLIDNACKYAARAEDRTLHIESDVAGDSCLLRVRDHGPGIDAGRRRVLFKAFHKTAQEAAISAPGVGLGLSLCRRLARDMGGDLRYEVASTGGACFVLRLLRIDS